jgi:hypothetical protein
MQAGIGFVHGVVLLSYCHNAKLRQRAQALP